MFLVICIAVIGRKGSFCVTETVIVCTYIMEGIRKNIVKRQVKWVLFSILKKKPSIQPIINLL